MRLVLLISIVACTVSCSPISTRSLNKQFRDVEKNFHDHTGFVLYDVAANKTVYDYNGSSYFTPASNTKIFTFYTSLKLLGDSIPAFKYVQQSDSLIVWGTGDPSLLNPNVAPSQRSFDFLKAQPGRLFISTGNFQTTAFGSGWAWDDYNDYYSAERSGFPIYGNTMFVSAIGQQVRVVPPYFQQFVSYTREGSPTEIVRNVDSNILTVSLPITRRLKKDVPMRTNPDLVARLLSDTLRRPVRVLDRAPHPNAKVFYSERADSLYKVMMQESDNFLAEQLLLVCAGVISDTLKPEIAIEHMKQRYFADFPDPVLWVDGSGLSRYNLFTPRTIVALWRKIYDDVPGERLFPLLAIGGKAGTIKNYFKGTSPYIFGKTGSLSNNHCLSGYLVTRSGKTLIFSFMNSNFTVSTAEVRRNMQRILNLIYEKY